MPRTVADELYPTNFQAWQVPPRRGMAQVASLRASRLTVETVRAHNALMIRAPVRDTSAERLGERELTKASAGPGQGCLFESNACFVQRSCCIVQAAKRVRADPQTCVLIELLNLANEVPKAVVEVLDLHRHPLRELEWCDPVREARLHLVQLSRPSVGVGASAEPRSPTNKSVHRPWARPVGSAGRLQQRASSPCLDF